MRIKDREQKSQRKKQTGQPAGKFHQDIRRLRAEKIIRHPAAESRAQALALRALHEDNQNHEQRDQHESSQNDIEQNLHERTGNMAKLARL